MKLKFKQVLKRKLYPTWVSTTKLNGCKAYILQMPNIGYYHFQIMCDNKVQYCSLDDGIRFDGFDDCCEASENWLNKNINKNEK